MAYNSEQIERVKLALLRETEIQCITFSEDVAEALAKAAIAAAHEWQPIETAPLAGQYVTYNRVAGCPPTHWMPLPTPPITAESPDV